MIKNLNFIICILSLLFVSTTVFAEENQCSTIKMGVLAKVDHIIESIENCSVNLSQSCKKIPKAQSLYSPTFRGFDTLKDVSDYIGKSKIYPTSNKRIYNAAKSIKKRLDSISIDSCNGDILKQLNELQNDALLLSDYFNSKSLIEAYNSEIAGNSIINSLKEDNQDEAISKRGIKLNTLSEEERFLYSAVTLLQFCTYGTALFSLDGTLITLNDLDKLERAEINDQHVANLNEFIDGLISKMDTKYSQL